VRADPGADQPVVPDSESGSSAGGFNIFAIDLMRGATRAVTNLDLGASEIAYATALSSTGRLGSFGRSSSALEIKPFRFSPR
jgi:hypothetical protein